MVIIDDADCLDVGLAVALVENLTARHDGQVLIVAVVEPGSALPGAFRSQVRRGVTSGLVYVAEADPDMGYESRLELARELRPGLPDAAARRIAQRTATFAEVFAVAAAPGLADIGPARMRRRSGAGGRGRQRTAGPPGAVPGSDGDRLGGRAGVRPAGGPGAEHPWRHPHPGRPGCAALGIT